MAHRFIKGNAAMIPSFCFQLSIDVKWPWHNQPLRTRHDITLQFVEVIVQRFWIQSTPPRMMAPSFGDMEVGESQWSSRYPARICYDVITLRQATQAKRVAQR